MTSSSTRRPRGRPPYPGDVTPAEQRVLDGLRRGLIYRDIADELGLSYDTVKYHVSNMLSKAGVESRDELVEWASHRPGVFARLLAMPLGIRIAAGAAAVGAFGAGVVLVAIAVSDSDGESGVRGADDPSATATAVTATATETAPVSTPTTTPPPTTGVPIVDQVIEAVLSGDVARVEALVDYQEIPCATSPQGIGAPPQCPAGVPDGSPLPAITSSSCEGSFIIESDLPALLREVLPGWRRVFSASQSGSGYAIVFTPDNESSRGTRLLLSAEGIGSLVSGCGNSSLGLALRDFAFLIDPPPPPPLPADARLSGVSEVDAVVEDVLTHDLRAILKRLDIQAIGCTHDPASAGPRCAEDAPEATATDAVRYRNCGLDYWSSPGAALQNLDSLLAFGAPWTVYSVSLAAPGEEYAWHLVFESPHRTGMAVDVSADQQIWRHDAGCGDPPENLVPEDGDFILPPP